MRSDNGPTLLALLRDTSAGMPGVELVEKASPECDHQQNGLAEAGVREVEGQARVLKSELDFNDGRRLEVDEPILAWLPRHAATVISRGHIGVDGRTPEQRRIRKKWTKATVVFGDICFFQFGLWQLGRQPSRRRDAHETGSKRWAPRAHGCNFDAHPG